LASTATSLGSAATTAGSMVEPSCGWVVFSAIGSAVTSTVSDVAPAERVTLMVAFVLTSTFTECWTSFLKPVASTVTEYTPGVRPVTEYVPALLVVA
jgi:hypothetical protein